MNFGCYEKQLSSLTVKILLRSSYPCSDRASDSESRGSGFDPHRWHLVVSLSKAH